MIFQTTPSAVPSDAAPAAVELYLIRHGNAKKLRGETYVTAPLTELGRKQAVLTGDYIRAHGIYFDGYYCSALKRAVETATLIGEKSGQTPLVRAGIQEMEYREIPAMVAGELLARTGLLNRYFQERVGKQIRFPMIGRVATGMLGILGLHTTGRVGVVVHGGVISSVLSWYFPNERRRWWRETVGNCSITRIRVTAERAELVEYDFVGHLGEISHSAHLPNYTLSAGEGV